MNFYSVEHPCVAKSEPFKYKAWFCGIYWPDCLSFYIFVFKGSVDFDTALSSIKSYDHTIAQIFPIHGRWLWFFDTVRHACDYVDLVIEDGSTRDINAYKRYLKSYGSIDCNLMHSSDELPNLRAILAMTDLRASGEIDIHVNTFERVNHD